MKWVYLLKMVFLMALIVPFSSIAQEEESAEISMDSNTDTFQELFFEALKQKGIENYDKAINALLKCKEIHPDSSVIDHELAKTYQLNNQLAIAQEYALSALKNQAENLWYLNTYIAIVDLGDSNFNSVIDQIPFDNIKLKENLTEILVKQKKYKLAKKVLKELKESPFTENMTARITYSSDQEEIPESTEANEKEEIDNPLIALMEAIKAHMEKEEYEQLNTLATSAMEEYPLQPYFYYAKGLALNRTSDFRQASDYLTMGLDFIYEDENLTFMFYKELATAYKGLGDATMANMYLSKIKNGS
ncbi:MAG: hypothetical protein HKO75_06425 [Flavobacteriaceae bacterium]|nr:hypothetical protein [Muriicola sp.]NNL39482.1 hypothetical protein [Flavobacteriaceae bacterium]